MFPQLFLHLFLVVLQDMRPKQGIGCLRRNLFYLLELKYIFYSGALSEEELISILGSLEVNTADALCVVPVNSEKVAERINEIAGKIPVAIFNEMCDGASTFLNVISDGYAEGQAIGAMVKNHCPPDSHVVMISTETYRSNIFADRIRGFYEVFPATSPSPIIDEINIEYFTAKQT